MVYYMDIIKLGDDRMKPLVLCILDGVGIRKELHGNAFMNTKLVFNVMCHKEIIGTYEGDRIDSIVCELFKLFDSNREFGFKIESPVVKEYSHRDYYMVSVEFDLLDFTNNG